jgi:acyl-CoA hydrolase
MVEKVSTLAADVHLVVTEHGVADLRGADAVERRRRLIAVAAPKFRDRLAV